MVERLTPPTPDLGVRGSSLARCVFFLRQGFIPFCLSSPRCINWCRRHTAWGEGEGDYPAME